MTYFMVFHFADLEQSCLPRELRQAGLLADVAIPTGKCFGPFKGQITPHKEVPDAGQTLVCQVGQ